MAASTAAGDGGGRRVQAGSGPGEPAGSGRRGKPAKPGQAGGGKQETVYGCGPAAAGRRRRSSGSRPDSLADSLFASTGICRALAAAGVRISRPGWSKLCILRNELFLACFP